VTKIEILNTRPCKPWGQYSGAGKGGAFAFIDFLQFMRILHCRRKCKMRMNCKKDAGKGSAFACT
jgi:hypothetical protein